jgi:hypothetical protein
VTEIVFQGAEHQRRFLAAVRHLGKVDEGNKIAPEYGAALFVLTAHLDTWNAVQNYVGPDGIFFRKMLRDLDWSGGYRVLLKWAANLFNEQAAHIDPVQLMRLDAWNFEIALSALRIRREGLCIGTATRAQRCED